MLVKPLVRPIVRAIAGNPTASLGSGFSPTSLFLDGSKGVLYDNNDLSSFYLDSAGTTAATVNGLVGLQLDKSQGLVLGPELVTNGDFSNGTTGWTASAVDVGLNVVSGQLEIDTNTSAISGAYQSFSTVAGKTYKATAIVRNGTATDARLRAVNGFTNTGTLLADSSAVTATTNTEVSVVFTAIGAASAVYLRVNGLDNTAYFDNISVRELPGNHRYQTTTGSKPVLRGTPTGANLVTNGDFASGTGWTLTSGATISGGTLNLDGNGAPGNVLGFQNAGLVTGRVYRATFTITAITGTLNVWDNGGAAIATYTTTGTKEFYFTHNNASGNFIFRVAIGANTASIDNVTIYDVSAGSVTAPYGLQYDGVDDFMQTASVDFATVTSDGLARRNLLTFPSAFDNAAWTKGNITVTANSVASPDGTVTADTLNEGVATNYHNLTAGSFSAGTYTISVYAKNVDAQYVNITLTNAGSAYCSAIYDVSNGTVASSGALASGFSVTSTSITSVGDGWYRCVMTCVIASTSQFNIGLTNSTTIGTFGLASYTGTSRSIYVWGAQVEAGSTASAFQDIGTDKMFVCAGVRKLSDAARGMLVELSATVGSNNGSFAIDSPSTALNDYQFFSRGTSVAQNATSGFSAPISNVVTGIGDISGDICQLGVNGVSDTISVDQGTGNFGNYAIYFGRRGGTSVPYNGLDFGMVICGKTLTSTQISQTERYIAQRTGVTI